MRKVKTRTKLFIWIPLLLCAAAGLAYVVAALMRVSSYRQPDFDYYEFDGSKAGGPMVLESDSLRFELDPETTQFSILQKQSGRRWYSSPPGLENDPIALAKEKNNMRSSLLVEYSTENGNSEVYDLYTNSVQRKFYSVEQGDGSVTVRYTIGQMNREYIFPPMMYQSDFDRWTAQMQASDVNTVSRAYHRYSMTTAAPGDRVHEPLYLVFENVQNFLKERLEQLFKEAGYTYEDYLESKVLYQESNEKELPAFNATLVYRLSGNRLEVELPFDEISYRQSFPITKVSVLPYFGAGDGDSEGSILVPEGGGGIIRFNNGKTKQNGYYADVYGWDWAQEVRRRRDQGRLSRVRHSVGGKLLRLRHRGRLVLRGHHGGDCGQARKLQLRPRRLQAAAQRALRHKREDDERPVYV